MTPERFAELRRILFNRGNLTHTEILELMAALVEAREDLTM